MADIGTAEYQETKPLKPKPASEYEFSKPCYRIFYAKVLLTPRRTQTSRIIYLPYVRHYFFSMFATTHRIWKPSAPSETWECIMMQWLKTSLTWEDTNTNDIYGECVQFKFVVIFQMRCCVICAIRYWLMCFLAKHAKKSRKPAVSNKSESVSDVRMFAFWNFGRQVFYLDWVGTYARAQIH
jgi:hypothetical protein